MLCWLVLQIVGRHGCDCDCMVDMSHLVILKLSIHDIIDPQKGSNGDGKPYFFRRGFILHCTKKA